jgi:hypothetical protein
MKTKVALSAVLMVAVIGLGLAVPTSPLYAGPQRGESPHSARELSNGLNVGSLTAGSEVWYHLGDRALGAGSDRLMVFNMVYRPGNHDVSPYVNFQIFSQSQMERWMQGYPDAVTGIGTFTTTDFDPDTSERLWSGSLWGDETYYLRLLNNADMAIEYHLMAMSQPAEIVVVEPAVAGGERPRVERAAAVDSPPALAPEPAPQPVRSNVSTPDDARWQLVVQAVQSMPPDQATQWLAQASQLGMLPNSAPAVPAQPRISAEAPPAAPAPPAEAAPAPQPVAAVDKYPSIYPNAALALHDGANTGRLAPGGEHWYAFIRQDFDDNLFEHMAITMFATPTDGNTSHHINFQIYPASQIHMWLRGTPKAMVPMGEGEWVSRDNDPVTGERLWSGTLVDGDTYYLRVFNNSDAVIDYYVINRDVINTELGERVFAANQYYPYVLYPAGSAVAMRNR